MIEIDNLGIFNPIEEEKEYALTDKDVRYELLRTLLAISPQNRRMFYALVRKKYPSGVIHCAINGPINGVFGRCRQCIGYLQTFA